MSGFILIFHFRVIFTCYLLSLAVKILLSAACPEDPVSEPYEGVSIIDLIIFLCRRKLHFSIELSSSTNTFDFLCVLLYLRLLTHVQIRPSLISWEMSSCLRFPSLPFSLLFVTYSAPQVTRITLLIIHGNLCHLFVLYTLPLLCSRNEYWFT